MSKLTAFDYFVNQIVDWYVEQGGDLENNDLSKLKLTKLLFFTCAASTDPENPALLETFDNFYALPYGHVESDIQDQMENSLFFNITKTTLYSKPGTGEYQVQDVTQDVQDQISGAVAILKFVNADLVRMGAFDLVDLSHRWQSWKSVFSLAQQYGKYSMKIPREMIMNEPKIFWLN
ncbi:type II toxin-antitoxin system antitoxin SocA domain-containing protein [Pedobacter sp. Leaf176]|uniref:type II toxin-antitoxin system antitoxin SocA domain-containing protein n=1 Tax=Pedobacter sp. Leaf176 TaxID=1736286 RepID=UPI0006FB90A9|nr:type II toxin-antitoxin system antitoxin SocA domain-containing protein [Pedobacter sp. Leaf176]KQR65343.1 hypothetical protein ASF92_20655 [Pedobacter sp. Leaf176]